MTAPRLLFVHAHPDDETITTGGALARYAAEGAQVTLVTCTRGELGEVIPPELRHLQAPETQPERDASCQHGDGLALHRERELAAAMRILNVTDHRFLGDVGSGSLPRRRFRDSGMVWGADGHAVAPAEMHPEALCNTDVEEPAHYLAEIIAETRPHVVVTYNDQGGYGHPDHIRAHELALRAVGHARSAGWSVHKTYVIDPPESVIRAQFDGSRPGFAEAGFDTVDPEFIPVHFAAEEDVTTAVDIAPWLDRKTQALSAHATQVAVSGNFMALSNMVGQHIGSIEYFRLLEGGPRAAAPGGREDSLTAGLGE